jgi:hypothetical protein
VTCEQIRAQLTAYLDGELEDERGSALRGHLRGCDACRQAAADEATLRDGLRALPALDPPPSLWAGVQARLAAAEVADAKRPAWRATLARWCSVSAIIPRLPLAGAVIAAVVLLSVWRARHTSDDVASAPAPCAATPCAPTEPALRSAPAAAAAMRSPTAVRDVSEELAARSASQTRDYAEAADELARLAADASASWPDERRRAFDARVTELRAVVEHATDGAPRQRAYRSLIRFLQTAAVRNEVAVNDRYAAPPSGDRAPIGGIR